MPSESVDAFSCFSLKVLENEGFSDIHRLPHLLKLLLENLLQFEDGVRVHKRDIQSLARAVNHDFRKMPLAFHPLGLWLEKREDLSALATFLVFRKIKNKVDLECKVEWMHGLPDEQSKAEYETFLKRFETIPNFDVHQNPLPAWLHFKKEDSKVKLFQESLIGTGSRIALANALGVLALQVGVLEVEAVLLNQPVYLEFPTILGVKLEGVRSEALCSEVCVHEILEALKQKKVFGRWLEFYGEGLEQLSHEERLFIAKNALALGALCAFFPVDASALQAMSRMFQDSGKVELIHSYVLSQGLWRDSATPDPVFHESLNLNFAQFRMGKIPKPSFPEMKSSEQIVEIPEIIAPPNVFSEAFCLNQARLCFPEQMVQMPSLSEEPVVLVARRIDEATFGNERMTRKTFPLSIKAVFAEQLISLHRADLIRLGIMPLMFKFGMSRESLEITGDELLDLVHLSRQMRPGMDVLCRMRRKCGLTEEFVLKCAIQTQQELECFQWGGSFGHALSKVL